MKLESKVPSHRTLTQHKVGGSLKRLKAAKVLLWQGLVSKARALFTHCQSRRFKNFIADLDKHQARIVNYSYYQAEQLCSIGSGAVESAIKQIGMRIKMNGKRWTKSVKIESFLTSRLNV